MLGLLHNLRLEPAESCFSVTALVPKYVSILFQDSALDTLSEARRAVLSDLPHPDYPTVSTSDPLQQARKLVSHSSLVRHEMMAGLTARYFL